MKCYALAKALRAKINSEYLLATLAAWREIYHAINICEKKLSQRRKERKDNARSKRF